MDAGQNMGPCAFAKLYTRNVPHSLEKILFSLDYESFKTCLNVNDAWHKLLSSEAFQKKAKLVFHVEISNDENALWHAASNNNVKEVTSLLSTGWLNINFEGGFLNTTQLHIATMYGHKNIVELLLERGARHDMPDKYGWYPLHRAVKGGQKYVVQILLDAGAPVNLKNNDGACTLYLAASYGCKDLVRLLLDRGAHPNTADNCCMLLWRDIKM